MGNTFIYAYETARTLPSPDPFIARYALALCEPGTRSTTLALVGSASDAVLSGQRLAQARNVPFVALPSVVEAQKQEDIAAIGELLMPVTFGPVEA